MVKLQSGDCIKHNRLGFRVISMMFWLWKSEGWQQRHEVEELTNISNGSAARAAKHKLWRNVVGGVNAKLTSPLAMNPHKLDCW